MSDAAIDDVNAVQVGPYGVLNDTVLDALYSFVDTMMCEGQLVFLDAMCKGVPVELGIDYVLAMLVSTLPVRNSLPERKLLLDRAKLHFGDRPGLWTGLD